MTVVEHSDKLSLRFGLLEGICSVRVASARILLYVIQRGNTFLLKFSSQALLGLLLDGAVTSFYGKKSDNTRYTCLSLMKSGELVCPSVVFIRLLGFSTS